jgi:hypothetical protein
MERVNFYWSRWDYSTNKNITTIESGVLVERETISEQNWGILNIKIIPDNPKLKKESMSGFIWISEKNLINPYIVKR